MSNRDLSLCLAAAAASGIVTIGHAVLHLVDLPADPPRPYWPPLRRALRRSNAWAHPPDAPERRGDRVLWRGHPIGHIVHLYKTPLPQEQQARIAYSVFLTRFFDYLWQHRYCVVLAENDVEGEIFVPGLHQFDLNEAWTAFVRQAFSLAELRRTFLAILNLVKLSRQGFSPPVLPPVTPDHAVALLGLYAASVQQRERDMRRKRRRLEQATGAGEQNRLAKELDKNHANYDDAIRDMDILLNTLPDGLHGRVDDVIAGMTRTGRTQIGPRPDYMKKCVTCARGVVETLERGQFASVRPLVSVDPLPVSPRGAGDDVKGVCYLCGVSLQPREGVEVSKLVVESPSQALQSSPRETRPLACPTCVQVSMLSPIKPSSQAVIVSLQHHDDGQVRYLYDDHVRQMVLGELNLVAGRYCQMTCTERVDGTDPLSQRLGQLQYAMLKVAASFPADSLRNYTISVSYEGGEIPIPRRHMVALSGLLAMLNVRPSTISTVRQALTGFSSAVRHLQADRYSAAVYEMIGTFLRGDDLNPVARVHLDSLTGMIADIWEQEQKDVWMSKGDGSMTTIPGTTKTPLTPSDETLQRYRDVLALTGLIVPFIAEARRVLRRRGESDDTIKRELSKIIEHVEGTPFAFCYDVAQALPPHGETVPAVFFAVGQDNRTIATYALDLLEQSKVPPSIVRSSDADATDADGDRPSEPRYRLTIDMLQGAYDYLFAQERYRSPKDRRDLAYQLKLSLYARFPQLIAKSKNDNEDKQVNK